MLRRGVVSLVGFHPFAAGRRGHKVDRPVIRRTRSWRGIMQVRFDDSGADRKRLGRQAFFWAPVRIFGLGLCVTSLTYFSLGHDQFMHMLLGYESEMQYESRVNPVMGGQSYSAALEKDKAWKSPLRSLERPLHPTREFDVFVDNKSAQQQQQ